MSGVDLSAFDDDTADARDELVEEARGRAEAGGAVPEDWGALVTLEVGETLSGRWRGDATDEEHDGRRVFRLWRLDGSLAWMRSYAALIREVDRAKPNIGDSVAIVRGEDYASKNGTGYSFGFAARPCSDSLPGSDDKNLPF